MSEPVSEGLTEPAEPGASTDASSWSATAYIAHDRTEPPTSVPEREALATWCAVSALWHPAILAVSAVLPRVEGLASASSAGPGELIVVPAGQAEGLPSGYRVQVEDAGSILVESGVDRLEIVRALLTRIEIEWRDPGAELAGLAEDFFALGTAWWWLRDLTVAMGHADGLDHDSLAREAKAGAAAWCSGDAGATRNRLRAAFELLAQARERFYPVDAYIVDICLLDPSLPAGAFEDAFLARAPVTFLAQGDAIEAQAAHDPEALAKLREAISEGWADVVGGAFREADDPLLPLSSILWQFREGGRVYREHLDGRNVETYARRRFGLYPMLPQIAKAFGFRFAVHLGFDAGRFPLRPEAKRLWEGPDHTSLETLTRPPLAGDRSAPAGILPWKLAASMKDDHVATLSIVHWPSPVAGWWRDLRRVAAYSPVLARWVTLNDYFHLTDRPYESFSPEPDAYVTPYLAQAVARQDSRPISRKVEHARLRARLEALETLRAMAATLTAAPDEARGDWSEIETAVEGDRHDAARAKIEPLEPHWAGAVARGVLGTKTNGRPGFLVINPACVARRAAVLLPGAAANLRPEGPLRAAQFTEEGVWGVVELPAYGFAWVPRDTISDAPSAQASSLSVRDRVLRNGSIVVEVDRASGGLRAVKAEGEETARLGQQIVIAGLKTLDAQPGVSRMRCDSFEVEYGGPALIQAVSAGTVTGPNDRPIASFHQESDSGRAGRSWNLTSRSAISTRAGSRTSPRVTRGRAISPVAGRGPIPRRCFGARVCSPPSSRRFRGPRPPTLSTSPRATSAPHSCSPDWPITSGTGRECSIPCS